MQHRDGRIVSQRGTQRVFVLVWYDVMPRGIGSLKRRILNVKTFNSLQVIINF